MFNNKGSKAKSSKINKKNRNKRQKMSWNARARAKFDDKSDKHLTKGNAAD